MSIKTADNQSIKMDGIGNVKLLLDTKIILTLTEVYSKSTANKNLISVSKLAETGFDVIFSRINCKVNQS